MRAGLLVFQADPGRQAKGGVELGTGIAGPPGGEEDLAQAVARVGLAGPVAGPAKHGARLAVQARRPLVLALVQRYDAKFGQHAGHPVQVACLAGQVHGLLQVVGGLLAAALAQRYEAQFAQRKDRACAVTRGPVRSRAC